jgi:hypothetical protein
MPILARSNKPIFLPVCWSPIPQWNSLEGKFELVRSALQLVQLQVPSKIHRPQGENGLLGLSGPSALVGNLVYLDPGSMVVQERDAAFRCVNPVSCFTPLV